MNDRFRASFVHLVPVLASLMFGALCTLLLSTSSIELPRSTIFSENKGGPPLNATYFVILIGVGAFMLYRLVKWNKYKLIKLITGFALVSTVFMLSSVYSWAALSILAVPNIEAFIVLISMPVTIFSGYAIFQCSNRVGSLIVVVLGGALGTFLGASIPTVSAILILCFSAVYDIFAVYRGPVGKIALTGLQKLRGLSFSFQDIQMGLGDLVFYSMLSGHVLLKFSLISYAATVLGIIAGCLLTFSLLEKKKMFPGLPFPVLFGLGSACLLAIIC